MVEKVMMRILNFINKTGEGNEFLGWLDFPYNYDREEFEKIKTCANQIKQNSDIFLVIGIGGSYLGARAAIEMLTHSFQNELTKEQRQVPKIIFVGHHMSSSYMNDLLEILRRTRYFNQCHFKKRDDD